MKQNSIGLIAAMNRKRVIGRDGQLPWRLSRDMQWFRQHTLGKPVIMGRKTCESLPKALPERHNILVTRQTDFMRTGFETAASIEAAIQIASLNYDGEIMIIGGEMLYRQTLSFASTLYLTEVDDSSKGDAFFPKFDMAEWATTYSKTHGVDEKNSFATQFFILKKSPNNS